MSLSQVMTLSKKAAIYIIFQDLERKSLYKQGSKRLWEEAVKTLESVRTNESEYCMLNGDKIVRTRYSGRYIINSYKDVVNSFKS